MVRSDFSFYEPSFFYIKLNTTKQISEIFGSIHEATFIHEYIHFLQDISLVSLRGLMRENVNNFRNYSREIREVKNFIRPIAISQVNGQINHEIYNTIWGSTENHEDVKIASVFFEDEIVAGRFPRKVLIVTGVSKTGPFRYVLGIRDFIESMAFAIENHIYRSDNAPDFPYRSIEKVLKHLGYKSSNLIVSQICEMALSYFDPVVPFKNFLDRNNKKYSTTELHDFMFSGMQVKESDGTVLSKSDSDARQFEESRTMLLDWFQSPVFKEVGSWLERLLLFGENQRKLDSIFISRLVFDPPKKARNRAVNMMVKTGIPLVVNKSHDVQIVDPSKTGPDTFYLLALSELYSFVKGTTKSCGLIEYCRKSPKPLVDSNCKDDLMVQLYREELCPIAAWIKTFGFADLR